MQLVKIYDKNFTELTTLSSEDFMNLSHTNGFREIGDAQFDVRLDSAKVDNTTMQKYNRIEIISDQQVKWVGIIVDLQVELDTATVRCRELTYILKKRLLGVSFVANGTLDTVATNILATVNAAEDTGISIGDVSGAVGSVNTTFQYGNAYDVLKQLCDVAGNQFYVNTARELVVGQSLGTDLSSTVTLRYNINQISASNILKFRVDDNGDNIVTKVFGKSAGFTSQQEDTTLKNKYGLLEDFRDFRVANTQSVLDDFTSAEVRGEAYSPQIDLNPDTPDNFNIGDTVKVQIKNALIDIDSSFQVLEKTVQYVGEQKRIKARINELPYDLAERIATRDARLALLEKEV